MELQVIFLGPVRWGTDLVDGVVELDEKLGLIVWTIRNGDKILLQEAWVQVQNPNGAALPDVDYIKRVRCGQYTAYHLLIAPDIYAREPKLRLAGMLNRLDAYTNAQVPWTIPLDINFHSPDEHNNEHLLRYRLLRPKLIPILPK